MFAPALFASLALAAVAADDPATELCIGDPAPKLQVQEFIRGEPFKQFEPGKTYVVEFWATSCGACVESIPHLAALQRKYKDVFFLGVSVNKDATVVKQFVAKMGGKMEYRVAIDARDGDAGKMAQAWLAASYQGSIPSVFIVNADGRVAWIGHPKELEKSLVQILAGKWDLAAEAAEYKKAITELIERAAAQKAAKELADRLDEPAKGTRYQLSLSSIERIVAVRLAEAVKDKRYDDVLKIIDEAENKHVELIDYGVGPRALRLAALVISGTNATKAVALANDLLAESDGLAGTVLVAIIKPQFTLERDSENRSDGLNFLLAPAKIDRRLAALAAKAADTMAKDFEQEHSSIPLLVADDRLLLAAAYHAAGQNEKAVRQYEKAEAALEAAVEQANDALQKSRAMEKELGTPKE